MAEARNGFGELRSSRRNLLQRSFHMKLLREILVYAVVIIAFVYAARQLEGVSLGRVQSDVPSFLKFLR